LEDLNLFARDDAENADAETRAGERMTLNEMVWDAQETTKGADLVWAMG